MSIREEIAKVEIGNVLDTDGKRIGGLVEIGDSGASQILSLIIGEIEKVIKEAGLRPCEIGDNLDLDSEAEYPLSGSGGIVSTISVDKLLKFQQAKLGEAIINKLKE